MWRHSSLLPYRTRPPILPSSISSQYARAISDQAIATWTDQAGGVTNLYQTIDEATADDADYIKSQLNPTAGQPIRFGLTALTDPVSSTGHVLRLRYKKQPTGGTPVDLTIDLLEGAATVRATRTIACTDAWLDYSTTLTTAEADSITNYAILQVRFTAVQV